MQEFPLETVQQGILDLLIPDAMTLLVPLDVIELGLHSNHAMMLEVQIEIALGEVLALPFQAAVRERTQDLRAVLKDSVERMRALQVNLDSPLIASPVANLQRMDAVVVRK
jgi:hypothetical protein